MQLVTKTKTAPSIDALSAFMYGTTSRARYDISRCNRWLQANAIIISNEINSALVLDRDATPLDIFFGLDVQFSETPRHQLVAAAYAGEPGHGYTYLQCYHLAKLTECRTKTRIPMCILVCKFADRDVIRDTIMPLDVSCLNVDGLASCVGILTTRAMIGHVNVILAKLPYRENTDIHQNQLKILFAAYLAAHDTTYLKNHLHKHLARLVPGSADRTALFTDVTHASNYIKGVWPHRWDHVVTDNNIKAALCYYPSGHGSTDKKLIQRLVRARPHHQVVKFAADLYNRGIISATIVDIVMHNNPEIPALLADPTVSVNWVPRLLSHTTRTSDVIMAVVSAPVLRLVIDAHVAAHRVLPAAYHVTTMHRAVEDSDEVFELILTLFAMENVSAGVYYAGIAHAAGRQDGARVRALMSIIDTL